MAARARGKFTPSVYEHAARFIGRSPWEASRNGHLLLEAHAEAYKKYHHSPVVIGIDIYNLESEAYGATVEKPRGNAIPAVIRHVSASAGDIPKLQPIDPGTGGRIPMVIETARSFAGMFSDADVRVPLSGPFSIASNLVGFETLLIEMLEEPGSVIEALNHLTEGQVDFCQQVASQGLDIAFFESAATPPLVSPAMFREVVLPPLKALLEKTAEIMMHPVPCIIGGDTAPIIDSIMETGSRYVICPSETNQNEFMDRMDAHPDVMVRINMDSKALVSGDLKTTFAEADRVIALARKRKKSCIGTGALPFETDPEIVMKTQEYVEASL